MKLRNLALACLAMAGAAAQAQSSVTLFGLVDLSYGHYSGQGNGSRSVLGSDAYQSSRLGFRGVEDLGGGLKAGFWLESSIIPDTGAGGTTNTNNQSSGGAGGGGLTFGRRSTVSLMGNWGELRLGRDYVPGFHNLSTFSPFGTNGVGSSGFLFYPVQSAARITNVRASNSIGYFLPKLGGFHGQAMYALGENASNAGATAKDGRVLGVRLGYGAGPWNVAVATTRTRISALGDLRQTNAGASYDAGFAKPMLLWNENRVGATRTRSVMAGATVPVGANGQVRISYATVDTTGVANDANHWAVGYVHNLSRRTALYATYGRIDNDGGTNYHVGQATTVVGGTSSGWTMGVRHSF
jgi:predicted porin